MNDDIRIISSEEELKVFSDPYRLKIINVFQANKEPLTVKGCADIMGEVPAKVYYHVKKLIKIDILVLDHIEVINGINAKYYRLVKDRFSVKLENSDQQNMYRQLNHVQRIIVQFLDEFKEDIIQATQYSVDNKVDKDSEVGLLSSTNVYLTEEEYKRVQELLIEIGETHQDDGEGKEQYNFVGGLARKRDEKKE